MSVATMVRRESAAELARRSVFQDRLLAAGVSGVVLAGCMGFWDWQGWDRLSVGGSQAFAKSAAVGVSGAMVLLAIGLPMTMAQTLAGERDRKGLDALLTTRLSDAEIVLGLIAAGYLRFLKATAAAMPVVLLLMGMGGLDPRLLILAALGLSTTALAAATIGVAASIKAPTANRASGRAAGWAYAWILLPLSVLLIRPAFGFTLPGWAMDPLLWAMDSSPIGLAMGLTGGAPRPWGLVEGVLRMSALQTAGAIALAGWASFRLRAACRSFHDSNVRLSLRNAARIARLGARRSIESCGEDPLFWCEVRAYRPKSRVAGWVGFAVRSSIVAGLALIIWWLAEPAFAELRESGYGPSVGTVRAPELNPLIRVLLTRTSPQLARSLAPEPGRARLEFNLGLKQISGMIGLMYAAYLVGLGAGSITRERQRDTWPGLLATPLTGEEIVRGKVRGAMWLGRGLAITLLAMWLVALATGALHPLGFLAATAWLAASSWFYTTLGIQAVLRQADLERAFRPSAWPLVVFGAFGTGLLMTAVPFLLTAGSLFGYDDVAALLRSAPIPIQAQPALRPWFNARIVALECLIGTAVMAWASLAITRSLRRHFDELVGRPTRSRAWAPWVIPEGQSR